LHRHALHHRELIVAAMRELAHQELGVLSPGLQLRCDGAVRAILRLCAPITIYFFPTGDFCLGSFPDLGGRSRYVWFTPMSGHRQRDR
jgi:hypothetical protein